MKTFQLQEQHFQLISKTALFKNIPTSSYPHIFSLLNVSIRQYAKDEILLHLGDAFEFSGIVLDGTVEGSFISESYNKINMNHFPAGTSFGEALATTQASHSPVQLRALTSCVVLWLRLGNLADADCEIVPQLSKNLIRILATQNVFSNLKLRIANQKGMRDRILMYLLSIQPDKDGYLDVPFSKTALAEFLGVNRSALSRELGRMQDEDILFIDGHRFKLLQNDF